MSASKSIVAPDVHLLNHHGASSPTVPNRGRTARKRPPSRTPEQWIAFIRDGDLDGDYETTHAACFAAALAMRRAGWDRSDWVAAMTNPVNALADHYRAKDVSITWEAGRPSVSAGRRKSTANARGRMHRDWSKAESRVGRTSNISNAADALAHIANITDAIARTDWKGRTAPRDRLVLEALVSLGEEKFSASPQVSLRTLCERTPIKGHASVHRALDSLEDSGWISRDHSGEPDGRPTIYRLNIPNWITYADGPVARPLPGGVSNGPSAYTAQPAVHAGLAMAENLGTHAALVYGALIHGEAQSVSQVAGRAGVVRSTAHKWLNRLAKFGLAYEMSYGWLPGKVDADMVAADRGAGEAVARRSERHVKERVAHRGVEAYEAARAVSSSPMEADALMSGLAVW